MEYVPHIFFNLKVNTGASANRNLSETKQMEFHCRLI